MARDRGMVTAEMAVCLPVLVLVLSFALSVVSVVDRRARVQDAAAEAARALARGDASAARQLAQAAAPGTSLRIVTSGGDVTVTATAHVALLASRLPSVTISASAVAELEPGDVASPASSAPP
jgi:Flp pilus assembly protein TadG